MAPVAVDIIDAIATITIAPRAGLYDRAFMEDLHIAAARVADTDAVRAVVLCAEGDFGLGWTPEALAEPAATPGLAPLGAGVDAVAAIPQPVIVAVEGRAFSAGLELALAGDIRVASERARFAAPDTQAGGVPLAGGTQRLPRAVGRAAALRLLLLGEEIDAAEALRIGLVSHIAPAGTAPAGTALDAACAIAAAIALRGPVATRLAKEAVHRGVEMPLAEALRYELDLTVILQSTADRAEGVRAFVEKRAPRFIGR